MEKEGCNIPWAILLDPTSACSLHCTGCWAAEYGNQLNLSLNTIDSIIRQGKELGTYMYIYTGGEPMVRKKDLIKICEMHPDCEFLAFTNGTLIDEEFCREMLRVKNFVPAISLEGFEEANDGRRGSGMYQKVKNAMALLKDHKLPFGISTSMPKGMWSPVCSSITPMSTSMRLTGTDVAKGAADMTLPLPPSWTLSGRGGASMPISARW